MTNSEPLQIKKEVKKLLVTGSSGLIGSEVVTFFCGQGWQVNGIDNNNSMHSVFGVSKLAADVCSAEGCPVGVEVFD